MRVWDFQRIFYGEQQPLLIRLKEARLKTEEAIPYGMISAAHRERYFPCTIEMWHVTIITDIKKM